MEKQKQEQISNVAGLVLAYALLTWKEVLPKVLDVPHDTYVNLCTKRWPRIILRSTEEAVLGGHYGPGLQLPTERVA